MKEGTSKIIKTDVSKYFWRIKDFGFCKKFHFNGIKTKKMQIGSSDYFWHAEIVNDDECTENRRAKCMNVIINRDEKVPRSYQKFTYDLKILYLSSRREFVMETENQMLYDHDKFIVADKFIDDLLMEFQFEIKLYEHDLTGDDIKSMNLVEYKMNIIKDLDRLLESGIGSDMEIRVDKKTFKLHKAIMARAPTLPNEVNDVDDEIFCKFLKFVYTGEFGSATKDELQKLKAFAEKIKFDNLEVVCDKMMVNNK